MEGSDNLDKLNKMTEDLEDQTEALYGIAAFATDGFWDWNIETGHIYYSPRYWELLGYDHTRIKPIVEEWHKRIHPDDFDKAVNELFPEHVKSKGVKPYYIVCRYRHGITGSWIKLICRGKVIKWDGDKPLRMVGTHTLVEEILED